MAGRIEGGAPPPQPAAQPAPAAAPPPPEPPPDVRNAEEANRAFGVGGLVSTGA